MCVLAPWSTLLPHLFFFVRRKWYPPFSQRFWATGDYKGRDLSSAYLLASFSASTNRDPSPLPLLVSALHRLHSKARIWFRPIHADASPSQLNQPNKPLHIARKLRFSEIRSGMLFITSLLVEDFRHSLILFVCFNFAPKNHGLVPQSELPLLGLCVTPYSIMPTSAFPIDWSMS